MRQCVHDWHQNPAYPTDHNRQYCPACGATCRRGKDGTIEEYSLPCKGMTGDTPVPPAPARTAGASTAS